MAFRVPDKVTMASQGRESSFAPFDLPVRAEATDLDGTDDQLGLFDFGTGEGKLWHLFVEFDDLDSGGTPSLVVDIDLVDEDGNVVTNLVATSAIAQTGGTVDAVHLGSGGGPEELDGVRYLAMQVVAAAATPQPGNIRVVGFYSPNV